MAQLAGLRATTLSTVDQDALTCLGKVYRGFDGHIGSSPPKGWSISDTDNENLSSFLEQHRRSRTVTSRDVARSVTRARELEDVASLAGDLSSCFAQGARAYDETRYGRGVYAANGAADTSESLEDRRTLLNDAHSQLASLLETFDGVRHSLVSLLGDLAADLDTVRSGILARDRKTPPVPRRSLDAASQAPLATPMEASITRVFFPSLTSVDRNICIHLLVTQGNDVTLGASDVTVWFGTVPIKPSQVVMDEARTTWVLTVTPPLETGEPVCRLEVALTDNHRFTWHRKFHFNALHSLTEANMRVRDRDETSSGRSSRSMVHVPWDENNTPMPDDQPEDLKELESYNILGADEEDTFDRLTALAQTIFQVPIALVSLLDTERQWFLSHAGLDARETPRCMAFCAFAIMKDSVFEVPNAFHDARFANNPLVTGPPNVVFYAGAPLITANGRKLGTFCIIDHKPKAALSDAQRMVLEALAAQTVHNLDLRRRNIAAIKAVGAKSTRINDLLNERHLLAHAMSAVSDGILLLTGDGQRITYVNRGVEMLTGYSSVELLGSSLSILAGEGSRKQDAEQIAEIFSAGTPKELTICQYRKDGQSFWNHARFTPVWYKGVDATTSSAHSASSHTSGSPRSERHSTQPDAWFVIASDDSGEVKIKENLQAAVDRAEDTTRAKSRFLANMSHELRTPLNAVIGCCDVLQESKTLGSEDREVVDVIGGASRVLLDLIGDVLNLSQVEASLDGSATKDVLLWELLDSVLAIFQVRCQGAGLDLRIDVDPQVPSVLQLNPLHYKQVLINLVGNALKFTDQGSVTIQVTFLPATSDEEMCTLETTVTDTGIGIPIEQLGSVFDAFTQVDESYTRRAQGSGLGLAISKQLVNRMGGNISAQSKFSEGSCFTFELPCGSAATIRTMNRVVPGGGGAVPATTLITQRPVLALVVGELSRWSRNLISKLYAHGAHVMHSPSMELAETSLSVATQDPNFAVVVVREKPDSEQAGDAGDDSHSLLWSHVVLSRDSSGATDATPGDGDLNPVTTATLTSTQNPSFALALEHLLSLCGTTLDTHENDPASEQGRPLRIAIVEDNAMNQKVLNRLLKSAVDDGVICQPLLYLNGKEIVEACQTEEFDVILMDLQMPVMGGLEASTKLRARWAAAEGKTKDGTRTAIIAITADVLDSIMAECRDAGMDGYLPKPVRKKAVIECLVALNRGQAIPDFATLRVGDASGHA